MITIYHNARCSKSRKALEILNERNLEINEVFYLENPLTKNELKDILRLLKVDALDLIRKKDSLYKQLVNVFSEPSNDQALEWMVEHPSLIERPIVINGDRAVIGRPPERVLEIL